MTLYQELQLNQAGSKALIKNAGNRREKQRHIGVYILKVFLTMAFCVAFISAFTALFGPENSIAGVVVLLAVMVFRQADLGIDSKQSFFVLLGIFGILSVGPHIAAVSSPITAFAVDFICIFALTFFGCHNILMSNHATFVLGYLLLSGNDVSGGAYGTRILGLMAGGLLTALIFYRNHYKITYKRRLSDLFREFYLTSSRTKWQLCITLGVALVMLVSRELGLPRPMWAGFAAMLAGSVPAIIAFCAFNLLCAPCFAAIGTIRRQMESAKWTWFAIGYMTVFAWCVGLMFYQFGGLITGELSFNFWTVVAIVVLGALLFQLFRPMPNFDKKKKPAARELEAEGSAA